MPAAVKPARNKPSLKRWRLLVIFVLCSVLPLLLFLYAADRFLRSTTTKNLLQQMAPAADLAANVIEEPMSKAKASLESLASDPLMLDAWARHDMHRVEELLQTVHGLKQEFASLAIYDTTGQLQVSYPKTSQAQIKVLSNPWFLTAMRSKHAYVSGSDTVGSGNNAFVTIAVSMNSQQTEAVIAATYTVDEIKSWTHNVAPSAMKWISILDQNGTVLAGAELDGPSENRNAGSRPEVKQVLAGQSGTEFFQLDGKQVLVSRHPLTSLGWGVLVEIPAHEINTAIWQFERPISVIALVFLGMALGLGIFIASLYRGMREREEHIQQIIAVATDAFVAIDANGLVRDWNPKAEQLFGWSKPEILGQPLHATIIPLQYQQLYLSGLKHFQQTGEKPVLDNRVELSALHRDGYEFPIELAITCVQRGGKYFFNAFLHDITKRKHAEEEIGNLNAELHVRVSELEERNKALEAFSYSVSHDVRAPLRNIAGFSEILHEEYAQQLTPSGLDYLRRIQKNVVRMQKLVEDLLRFARLGEEGLNLQITDLNEVVQEVIAGFEHELIGRSVAFEISLLPAIECDRSLITQVFWNLLANAIKFTRLRQRAVISIGKFADNGEHVFYVRDNGAGFDMQYADKLFGAFQRLHRDDEFEGTGVGLATVHRIVVRHHGRIWAHSEQDQGAAFFFSLQAQKFPAEKAAIGHAG